MAALSLRSLPKDRCKAVGVRDTYLWVPVEGSPWVGSGLVVLGVRMGARVMEMSLEGAGLSARRRRTGALVVILTLALAACADPSTSGAAGGTASGYAGFPSCAGAAMVTADAALYRDEPRYGNATELVEAVHAWASGQTGFEQLWLDRDHNGWVTVGFQGADLDIAALQEQAAQEFPGEGVVVVAVPYTLAELQTLMDRVMPALAAADATPTGGVGLDVPRGLMSLSGVPANAESEEALRQFAGEPLCVDAVDPSAFVPEGDQPTEGEGWRLLGHAEGAGEAYRTAVATTDEQLAAVWAESGLVGTAPDVDWQTKIVVWFGAVYGSSCPVRLDGVVVEGATLHGQIVIPGSGPDSACNDDANPHSFVVAVERTLLPAGPFVVQLDADDPPPGAPEERTVVDVDLSAPGTRAADEQLHGDPQAGFQPGPLVEDGHEGLPANGSRYAWNPRPQCSGVVIGPIDETLWRLADGEAEWTEVNGQELSIHPIDDEAMVLSSPGMDYLFVRATDNPCDS